MKVGMLRLLIVPPKRDLSSELRWYFWLGGCLTEVLEKTKSAKINKYATAFRFLWGFRCGFMVGVRGLYRSDIGNL